MVPFHSRSPNAQAEWKPQAKMKRGEPERGVHDEQGKKRVWVREAVTTSRAEHPAVAANGR